VPAGHRLDELYAFGLNEGDLCLQLMNETDPPKNLCTARAQARENIPGEGALDYVGIRTRVVVTPKTTDSTQYTDVIIRTTRGHRRTL
jgi:hypothetical protein